MTTGRAQSQPIPRVTSIESTPHGLGRKSVRLCLLLILLTTALVGQFAIARHLAPATDLPPGALTAPLADLPRIIGDWRGEDRPVLDQRSLYADQHLQRGYVSADGKHAALLWMAFSAVGADRGHHPEVCMAVADKPEDISQRLEVESPGHDAKIQQYCYGSHDERQLVFYWHYTLPTPGKQQLSEFQQAFRRLRARPASITVEVFVPHGSQSDGEVAREFVRLVDQEIQALVGPQAERGSQRLPVTVIPTTDPGV